jgi:hypothetical protein
MDTLPGACAWVWFTLEKFSFREDGNRQRDTFIANIDSIRAITKPDVNVVTDSPFSSPKKRKVIYKTDPLSPSKGKGKGRAT